MRVLVVEDNRRMAALLQRGLRDEGWTARSAHDGPTGLAAARERGLDVIVLDWMLPGFDGLELLERLRAEGIATPVLMLTAKDAVGDRVAGLNAGADDYLVKPFSFDELVARLRALARRTRGAASNVLRVGDLEVDTTAKTVTRGGETIVLSAREYAVLECLVARTGRVVSREQLFAHVYDDAAEVASNVIDVYVGQLRKKIDNDRETKLIQTRRGLGYVLEAVS